jgi:hypothetical protein
VRQTKRRNKGNTKMIELEKEFFDTFNIKQCGQCEFTGSPNCSTCEVCYPILTAEI